MADNNIDQKIQSVVGETIEDAIENEEPVEIEIVTEETIVDDYEYYADSWFFLIRDTCGRDHRGK